ncbi:hypothetical protein ACWPKO_11550 [Coraliomargarita sp. W4R53]
MKIFYSWQSDSPNGVNRRFIREALDEAIAQIKWKDTVFESPRVDSGMEGISGTPEVASVMFDKISESSLFVGDMTLVGLVKSEKEDKKVSNPNVTLELGYAAGILGWGRVICVMNEAFGKREEQAFDVRNRRFPISYTLEPGAEKKQVKENLVHNLVIALKAAENSELQKVDVAMSRIDQTCLKLIHSFGHSDYFAETPLETTRMHTVFNELIRSGVPRMLDLSMIITDNNGKGGLYAYHWTYLGKKVVERIKGKKIQPSGGINSEAAPRSDTP